MSKRSSLAFVAAAVLGLALVSGVAQARPVDFYRLYLLSFGEPVAVGVLASAAGASINNATTAAPFSMPAASTMSGQVITVQCDAVAHVGFGATTCGTTLATSPGCFRVSAAGDPLVVIVQDTTTGATNKVNAAGPAAFNCVVNRLR